MEEGRGHQPEENQEGGVLCILGRLLKTSDSRAIVGKIKGGKKKILHSTGGRTP